MDIQSFANLPLENLTMDEMARYVYLFGITPDNMTVEIKMVRLF